jgi:hypothetical protein
MGLLNRKNSTGGAAGGAPAAGTEFFSTAEASQLNTLLRGGGPGTSGEVVGSGSDVNPFNHSGSGDGEAPSSEDAQVCIHARLPRYPPPHVKPDAGSALFSPPPHSLDYFF